jgi:type IV secretion system protein VirD4
MEKYDELDCHVESVDVGSEQPHSRIAEMQAQQMLEKFQKMPDDGKPEPAKLDGGETVVAAEPKMTTDSDFIDVNGNSYLDDFYEDF